MNHFINKLSTYSTEHLIDCLPQNRPLYKDSGLWQIRSDNMEDVIFCQSCDESLRDFIIRYAATLSNDNVFLIDLVTYIK